MAGNVKDEGVRAIEEHGPFDIDGEPEIMRALDALLQAFVVQHRMKLPGGVGVRAVLPGARWRLSVATA